MTVQQKKIRISRIRVSDDQRPLKEKELQAIANSIKEIGLKTPITVRRRKKGGFDLISGYHRLEATKSLGRQNIDAFIIDGTRLDARLWHIAENLHRADLSPLQRSQDFKIWEAQLAKSKAAQCAQPGGLQPHDKGISWAARESGMGRDKVRRLRQMRKICPEAQTVAEKAGLNQAGLLKVAKESGKKAQLNKVAELASRKNRQKSELSIVETRQLKRLTGYFNKASKFKREWRDAKVSTRLAFVKTVLRPSHR